MSSDITSVRQPAVMTAPGRDVLVLVRRLIITAILAGAGYSSRSHGVPSIPGWLSVDVVITPMQSG
jgi:hypothetical protein